MEDIVIQVENVSKVYKLYNNSKDRVKEAFGLAKKPLYQEYFALKDISLEIKRGECVGIIGTNGAGKSTLLKIITGVLKSTEGDITVKGRISALLELGAGFNMEYTGIENVYINGRMNGFTKKEIDEKLEDILAFADIGDFVYQPVKTYSSGMFVRLAFAVAINIEPEILIVDEALSVGDIFFQAKCFRKFEEFKNSGKTILFVSHSLGSIQKYCDKAILLNKGIKIAEDTPKVVIDLYNKILVEEKKDNILSEEEDKKPSTIESSNLSSWKEKMLLNQKAFEYGNKEAEIVDFCILDEFNIITNTIRKGEKFKVKVRVRFNEAINEPIIAFTIKDLKGVELTGTNTLIEQLEMKNPEKGECFVITFEQQMDLQSYEYLLALGCTGFREGKLVVYHRLYDVCHIVVTAENNSVGIFDMNSKLSVEYL